MTEANYIEKPRIEWSAADELSDELYGLIERYEDVLSLEQALECVRCVYEERG